jgi:hypothetical protein
LELLSWFEIGRTLPDFHALRGVKAFNFSRISLCLSWLVSSAHRSIHIPGAGDLSLYEGLVPLA